MACGTGNKSDEKRRGESIKDERQTQRKTGKAIIKGNSRERVIADVTKSRLFVKTIDL